MSGVDEKPSEQPPTMPKAPIFTMPQPRSWNLAQCSSDGGDVLNSAIGAISERAAAAAAVVSPGVPDSKEVECLKEAIAQKGKIDSRSALGQRLAREIKADAALKQEYLEAKGKRNAAAMNDFRAKYCVKKYVDLEQKKTKGEETFDLTSVDAEYCTFSRIVNREGNDVPAFQTSQDYCNSVLELWGNGEQFHGHPWAKWDPLRKTGVILHYREKVGVGLKKTWGLTTISSTAAMESTPGTTALSVDDTPAAQGGAAPDSTPGEKEQKRRRLSGATNGEANTGKPNTPRNTDAEKEQKKRLTNAITKLQNLKKEHDMAVQSSHDLLELIGSRDEWRWCNQDILLKPIRDSLQDVEKLKNATDLWKAWTLEASFAAYARKTFTTEDILAHSMGPADAMHVVIQTLASETDVLKKMQSQRQR